MKINISDKPMMANAEIEIIDSLIEQYKPKFCLEWGAGISSIYFPKKHICIKNWLAVEENGHYVDFIGSKVKHNTTVVWEPRNEFYQDCAKHSRKYDFILIDGYDRQRCLEIARDIVTDNGIILLHDAGRIEYTDMIRINEGKILSQGEIPVKEGGFAHRGLAMFRGRTWHTGKA